MISNPTLQTLVKEIERLKEIEHLIWHILEDSEENNTGTISFEQSEDYRQLCKLLPVNHPLA